MRSMKTGLASPSRKAASDLKETLDTEVSRAETPARREALPAAPGSEEKRESSAGTVDAGTPDERR